MVNRPGVPAVTIWRSATPPDAPGLHLEHHQQSGTYVLSHTTINDDGFTQYHVFVFDSLSAVKTWRTHVESARPGELWSTAGEHGNVTTIIGEQNEGIHLSWSGPGIRYETTIAPDLVEQFSQCSLPVLPVQQFSDRPPLAQTLLSPRTTP